MTYLPLASIRREACMLAGGFSDRTLPLSIAMSVSTMPTLGMTTDALVTRMSQEFFKPFNGATHVLMILSLLMFYIRAPVQNPQGW